MHTTNLSSKTSQRPRVEAQLVVYYVSCFNNITKYVFFRWITRNRKWDKLQHKHYFILMDHKDCYIWECDNLDPTIPLIGASWVLLWLATLSTSTMWDCVYKTNTRLFRGCLFFLLLYFIQPLIVLKVKVSLEDVGTVF